MINKNAKTILCFGDSNTWGNVPRSDLRHLRGVRWPSALQDLLGPEYEVVSEGLPGRTFVALEKNKPHRQGITHLRAILESADPVDLVIVMLGTNDVKTTFNLSAEEIAAHLDQTLALIQGGEPDLEKVPKVLVVCPPPVVRPEVNPTSAIGQELDARMVRAPELFKTLPGLFERVAEARRCAFLDAGAYISSSRIDGYHWDADAHVKFAGVMRDWIVGNI